MKTNKMFIKVRPAGNWLERVGEQTGFSFWVDIEATFLTPGGEIKLLFEEMAGYVESVDGAWVAHQREGTALSSAALSGDYRFSVYANEAEWQKLSWRGAPVYVGEDGEAVLPMEGLPLQAYERAALLKPGWSLEVDDAWMRADGGKLYRTKHGTTVREIKAGVLPPDSWREPANVTEVPTALGAIRISRKAVMRASMPMEAKDRE
jgi:hypothetical protein